MARRTKKVGSSGTYGARYGVSIRRIVSDIKAQKIATYDCPTCSYAAVKREGTGIWLCRHCGAKFAGGAYSPTTATGKGKVELKAAEEETVEEGSSEAPKEKKEKKKRA